MPPALGTSESSSDAAQLRLVATVTLALSLSGISDIEGRKVHLKLDFFSPSQVLDKSSMGDGCIATGQTEHAVTWLKAGLPQKAGESVR